jgi:hypothetical protein
MAVSYDLSSVVNPQQLLQELLHTEVNNCDCKDEAAGHQAVS